MSSRIKIAVLGGSGYTGAEILRLLALHPFADVCAVSAERRAGEKIDAVHAGFGGFYPNLSFVRIEDINLADMDIVFCALPHGTTQDVVAEVVRHTKVVDLSADFRLFDVRDYEKWYGSTHKAVEAQRHAVYGLTEWYRKDVAGARLVANPGCYPTAAQMALLPLLEHGAITEGHIIIDAKSGVSGAGRSLKDNLLYSEVNEGFAPYGIGAHRHIPEIEQAVRSCQQHVTFSFTPHLVPMNRGILETIHVSGDADHLRTILSKRYEDEPFVQVLPEGETATTHAVRGTNNVRISVHNEYVRGRAVIVSAIDNLVKGASGQAIQNMNLMCGLPEGTGLNLLPIHP